MFECSNTHVSLIISTSAHVQQHILVCPNTNNINNLNVPQRMWCFKTEIGVERLTLSFLVCLLYVYIFDILATCSYYFLVILQNHGEIAWTTNPSRLRGTQGLLTYCRGREPGVRSTCNSQVRGNHFGMAATLQTLSEEPCQMDPKAVASVQKVRPFQRSI